ncbi:MAG: RluA family pseudouridine synthase [Erysipelotrichaceae bacterium]|jgi:23S rRNA pseudouridine955/2504/2580 synthase|nr:RluA family pseudouridine synthase [Erysipelotrichaceae bacterium]
MLELRISSQEQNLKLLSFVKKTLKMVPLSLIYRLFREKEIKVNGRPQKEEFVLTAGDVVRIFITENSLETLKNKTKEIKPQPFPYEIIYEDQNILIVNKPKGILVHGVMKENMYTLQQAVINYLVYQNEYQPDNSVFVPAPAHRLDFNTTGLVIFGKNTEALQTLFEIFKAHNLITKTYLALVVGKVSQDGTIKAPLYKNNETARVMVSEKLGKPATTIYHVEERFKETSLLKVTILTGRTHQIRVHLEHLQHPIVGDDKYGAFNVNHHFKKLYNVNSQMLHAHIITLGQLPGVLGYLSQRQFVAPLLPDFQKLIMTLRKEK